MKTLVVFYPGCIEYEEMLAAELLHKHMPLEIATPDGEDHLGSNGMRFRSDHAYQTVDASSYGAVLVPGGDPKSVVGNATLTSLLRRCHERGAVVGAVCAGPLLLAAAGLLVGRRFTHGY